jgi:hypothetical protein
LVDNGRKKRLKDLEENLKVTHYAATCVHNEMIKKTGFKKEVVVAQYAGIELAQGRGQ